MADRISATDLHGAVSFTPTGDLWIKEVNEAVVLDAPDHTLISGELLAKAERGIQVCRSHPLRFMLGDPPTVIYEVVGIELFPFMLWCSKIEDSRG